MPGSTNKHCSSVDLLSESQAIAWPTVALWMVLIAAWVGIFILGATGEVPFEVCTPVSALLCFWLFVPYHEASHGLIGRKRILSQAVGHVSAIALMAPFAAWVYLHGEHHKHTNDPQLDPDHYTGRGPRWQLPFRWLTLDVHFYFWMQRQEGGLVFVLGLLGVAGALAALGHGMAVLFCWLVPARLATGLVCFSFTYLPHWPHRTTRSENAYQATRIILGSALSAVTLFENYHLIHHLHPNIPFYRYRKAYLATRDELLANDAAIWPRQTE